MNANETIEFSELTNAGQCLEIYLYTDDEICERYTEPAISSIAAFCDQAVQAAARLVKKYDHMTPTAQDIDQVMRDYVACIVDSARCEIEHAK